MDTSYEKISKNNSTSQGKTDANLANDSNHLGGIEAAEYATRKYVEDFHNQKEEKIKEYIDSQDNTNLDTAKEYANSLVRNQDFSDFAKTSDINALNIKLSNTINSNATEQKNYTDNKIQGVVNDVNSNFEDVEQAIASLQKTQAQYTDTKSTQSLSEAKSYTDEKFQSVNSQISSISNTQNELFQSVSDGKSKIAGAITDKGITTSASDTFQTMANNISQITTGGGSGGGTSGGSEVTEIYKTIDPTFEVASLGVIKEAEFDENGEYTGRVYFPSGVYAISENGYYLVCQVNLYEIGGEYSEFLSKSDSDIRAGTIISRYIQTMSITSNGLDSEYKRYSFEGLGLDTENDIDGMSIGNRCTDLEYTWTNQFGVIVREKPRILCVVQKSNIHFYIHDGIKIGKIENVEMTYWHWQVSTSSFAATSIPAGANLSAINFGCFAYDVRDGNPFVLLFNIDKDSSVVSVTRTKINKSINPYIYYSNPCFFSAYDNYLVCYTDNRNISGMYGSMGYIARIKPSSSGYTTKSNNAWQKYTNTTNPVIISISDDECYAMFNSTIYSLSYSSENAIPELTSLFDIGLNFDASDYTGQGAFNPEIWFSPGNEYIYVRYRAHLYRYALDFENNTATRDNDWSFPSGMTSRGNCVFDKDDGGIHLIGGDIANLNTLYQTGGTKKLIGVEYKGSKFYLTGESEDSEESESSGAFGGGEGGGGIR